MECSICMELMDEENRRPKVLPCGHSFCLPCLEQKGDNSCAVDRKLYNGAAQDLPDNYSLLDLSQRESKPTQRRWWCQQCKKETADDECLDFHQVVSLKKIRMEEVQQLLNQHKAGVASLEEMVHLLATNFDAFDSTLESSVLRLHQEVVDLRDVQDHLQAALEADSAVWELAKQQSLEQSNPPAGQAFAALVVQLLSDLRDPTVTCSLAVHRGGGAEAAAAAEPTPSTSRATTEPLPADGGVGQMAAWTARVQLSQDPLVQTLLCCLLCDGELQQRGQDQQEHRQQDDGDLANNEEEEGPGGDEQEEEKVVEEVAGWLESDNGESAAMAAMDDETPDDGDSFGRLVLGSRVVRGKGWGAGWADDDGTPPGPGVVTRKGFFGWDSSGVAITVLWEKTGRIVDYVHVPGSQSPLRLEKPVVPLHPPQVYVVPYVEAGAVSCSKDDAGMTAFLELESLQTARGLLRLHCDVRPAWSRQVLERASASLEVLDLVQPGLEHLEALRGMPQLCELHVVLTRVDRGLLEKLLRMPTLRRLEAHCSFGDALARLRVAHALPSAGLRWLCSGLYPLRAALVVARAHAATLEELELVAATDEPYGCPDLAGELARCSLRRLRRLVLWRRTASGLPCRHSVASCEKQRLRMRMAFCKAGKVVEVVCKACGPGLA